MLTLLSKITGGEGSGVCKLILGGARDQLIKNETQETLADKLVDWTP